MIVIQDGGLPGSTGGPDGGTKPGAAIARQPIGTRLLKRRKKVGNGVATVPGVKTGRPAAMGKRAIGNKRQQQAAAVCSDAGCSKTTTLRF